MPSGEWLITKPKQMQFYCGQLQQQTKRSFHKWLQFETRGANSLSRRYHRSNRKRYFRSKPPNQKSNGNSNGSENFLEQNIMYASQQKAAMIKNPIFKMKSSINLIKSKWKWLLRLQRGGKRHLIQRKENIINKKIKLQITHSRHSSAFQHI